MAAEIIIRPDEQDLYDALMNYYFPEGSAELIGVQVRIKTEPTGKKQNAIDTLLQLGENETGNVVGLELLVKKEGATLYQSESAMDLLSANEQ